VKKIFQTPADSDRLFILEQNDTDRPACDRIIAEKLGNAIADNGREKRVIPAPLNQKMIACIREFSMGRTSAGHREAASLVSTKCF